MEKNGLGARNPSVRLVWHESKFCGNKRPNSELICPGVGMPKLTIVVIDAVVGVDSSLRIVRCNLFVVLLFGSHAQVVNVCWAT